MTQSSPSTHTTSQPSSRERRAIFGILQRCRGAKLVEPVGEAHLYYSAANSGLCRLTALGRHYWQMASRNLI